MVSATSVERPEAMSCAPSGATPIVSTTPSGGERSCPLPVRGEIPPDGNPPWRAVEERNRVRELYSARPEQGFSIEGPSPCALSLELPGAERSGEGVQTKPQPRLYHIIQPQQSWMSASTGWLLLYCHEGKNPILTRFAPKAHFRNFL